ncbi:retinol dehydrogenase 11-like protein [Dinothrombium tinctorium]|uniref:Retinol dehydrogenase 11-like protein n=1 Tax=Dinothrombium tinctorium TaxID=1965070 RepID=A0A3S3P9C2_9ACAR|nr:retinol dehydrogenase 11-like protein [Dinothrombium tinctorium]
MSSFKYFFEHLYIAYLILSELLLYLFQRLLNQAKCESKRRLDGNVVVVTGSTSGIGKMCALLLADRGAKVIMACRNLKEANAAADEIRNKVPKAQVCVMHLDLTSLKSVESFARSLIEQEDTVDILINNAGCLIKGDKKTEDGFEIHFGVNYLGSFLLSLLLLSKLKQSSNGKIINVSSEAHKITCAYPGDMVFNRNSKSYLEAYGISKLAQILFTRELAKRFSEVNAYAMHPGLVATNISRDLKQNSTLQSFFEKYLMRDCIEGSQTILHCILDECANKESGFYYRSVHNVYSCF